MVNRDRAEIMAQILEAANGGSTKTKIMCSAFINDDQLMNYLGFLTDNGLIDKDSQTNTYKTTEKGLRFIAAYDQARELVSKAPSADKVRIKV